MLVLPQKATVALYFKVKWLMKKTFEEIWRERKLHSINIEMKLQNYKFLYFCYTKFRMLSEIVSKVSIIKKQNERNLVYIKVTVYTTDLMC